MDLKRARRMLTLWSVVTLPTAIILIGTGRLAMWRQQISSYDEEKDYLRPYPRGFCIFVTVLGPCLMVFFILHFFVETKATKRSIRCLTTYCVLAAIFILAGIAGAITGFVLRNKVGKSVEMGMTELYDTYRSNDSSKSIVDSIQIHLECCGPDGTWPASQGDTPSSCTDVSGIQYSDGCNDQVRRFFDVGMLPMVVCLIVATLVLILGFVFAVCVFDQSLKNDATA